MREVATEPPWSMLMSTMTDPGCIWRTRSSSTSMGALAPATSTAPMTTSAFNTCSSMVSRLLISASTPGILSTSANRSPLPPFICSRKWAPAWGANFLEKMNGGKGKLLAGATGVASARVLVLGAGISGTNAALIAAGMGARVVVLDKKVDRLAEVERIPGVEALMSNRLTIEEQVLKADVVIGAVLVAGARAPMLVEEDLVRQMQPGSVIVDISIDQGGSVATSRMTTHSDPTYTVHEVVHYAVGNMPGAVPITSTLALTNVTLAYIVEIAERGVTEAARLDPALARGVNVMEGKVTNEQVAAATRHQYFPIEAILPIEYT